MKRPVVGITKRDSFKFEFPKQKLTIIRNLGFHIVKIVRPKKEVPGE
jgi:hypothetical protein